MVRSNSVTITEFNGDTRILALKDFYTIGKEISAGTVGGIVKGSCEIVGNSWIDCTSVLCNSSLVNSRIYDESIIVDSKLNYSEIASSRCYTSLIDNSSIFYCSISETKLHNTSIEESIITNCRFSESRIIGSNLASIKATDLIMNDTKLFNININDSLEAYDGNLIIFNAFWNNGETFFYHIPTKTWYMNNFSGGNEAFLAKIYKMSLNNYLMYKNYMDFVEKL